MRSGAVIRIAAGTAAVLLVPLVAMQMTDEVDWTPGDFVVAGILLFGAGLAYVSLSRRRSRRAYRVVVGISIAAVLLVVWAGLAVGTG